MKGDQIIHVFICEALVVLLMSYTGVMEAVWAHVHQVLAFPLKEGGPTCQGDAGPAVTGQNSWHLPWLWTVGPLHPPHTDFSVGGGKCSSSFGSSHPSEEWGLSNSHESLFRELSSTCGTISFPSHSSTDI